MPKLESLHRRLIEEGPKHLWEQLLFLLLRVCAILFCFGVLLRDQSFRLGLRKVYKSRLPVISVGNLAVGGTGKTLDWGQLSAGGLALILAGGLKADNVAAAVRTVRPWAVDVSSGVESSPGVKDPFAIRQFIKEAKREQ